ncbi:MAG: UDP-N-acetylglucosamine 2-epimerase (non-hydrolyzing) [Rhodothermales bacterium]|nr:UDP-N-acetylglucosamine 2-epimerase (non-hydrolyzing) [Rhodothermales bacterium]
MRICTVVGARPQFVKAWVVSQALEEAGIQEYLVHTGQHYDYEMSQVFFSELGLRSPDVNLGVGSASQAVQTARMMTAIEDVLQTSEGLEGVLVYGDTNSTLAASMAAVKLGMPLFHVEAGLRSYNRKMPEEINRVVTDRLATLLFCPTHTSITNLESEGITNGVVFTGDVMFEGVRRMSDSKQKSKGRGQLSNIPSEFILATVHRPSNVDDTATLSEILSALGDSGLPVVFPVHPRTAHQLEGLPMPENVIVVPPVGYGDMIGLIHRAQTVITDSGGVQKEAFWLATPCITLRDETEWKETLRGGWNQLAGARKERILSALKNRPTGEPEIDDPGNASAIISESILGRAN